MGLSTVQSRAAVGIEAPEVLVEVNLSPGLPMFAIVGLPETAFEQGLPACGPIYNGACHPVWTIVQLSE
jgi:hypothetical protein